MYDILFVAEKRSLQIKYICHWQEKLNSPQFLVKISKLHYASSIFNLALSFCTSQELRKKKFFSEPNFLLILKLKCYRRLRQFQELLLHWTFLMLYQLLILPILLFFSTSKQISGRYTFMNPRYAATVPNGNGNGNKEASWERTLI